MNTNTTHNANIATSRSALYIVNEMTDREQQKQNIVVYNFQCVDHKTDIDAFQTLCSTVLNLYTNICKAIQLVPKIANKHRPLLLIFEDIDDKVI